MRFQSDTSTIGGSHHAFGLPARVEAFDGTRLQVEGKRQQVKTEAIERTIRDSFIVCTFPGLALTMPILPARLLQEPKPDGPTKGYVVPLEELLDDFYQTMGWDSDRLPHRCRSG